MTDMTRDRLDRIETLIANMDAAMHALSEWRRQAGPKARWSGHERIHEAALFRAAEDCADALTRMMQEILPDRWSMGDWVFRPTRMGDTLNWCGKGGKARNGYGFHCPTRRLFAEIGALVGVAMSAESSSSDMRTHPFWNEIESEEKTRFVFYRTDSLAHFRRPVREEVVDVYGCSPRDAWAKAIMSKMDRASLGVSLSENDTRDLSSAELLERGMEDGAHHARHLPGWSIAPTLWSRLRKTRLLRRLSTSTGARLPKELPSSWLDHDPADYEAALAAAIGIADIAAAPNGRPQPYLVRSDDEAGVEAWGWCGASAILHRMVRQLHGGQLPHVHDLELSQAFALADECGEPARDVVTSVMWRAIHNAT